MCQILDFSNHSIFIGRFLTCGANVSVKTEQTDHRQACLTPLRRENASYKSRTRLEIMQRHETKEAFSYVLMSHIGIFKHELVGRSVPGLSTPRSASNRQTPNPAAPTRLIPTISLSSTPITTQNVLDSAKMCLQHQDTRLKEPHSTSSGLDVLLRGRLWCEGTSYFYIGTIPRT